MSAYYCTYPRTSLSKRNVQQPPTNRKRLGRIILLVTALMIVCASVSIINAYAVSVDDASVMEMGQTVAIQAEHDTVFVNSGDTLWSIAKNNMPENSDIREYISELRRLNELNGSSIRTGQKLILPLVE